MTPLLRRSSLRYLLRHPWLAGLSVLGVAVAVAVVVGIDLASASARRAFELSVEGVAGRATHEIASGPAGLDEGVYTTLRTGLGVRGAAPIVEGTVTANGDGRALRLFGVDLFVDPTLRSFSPRYGRGDGDAAAFLTRADTAYLGTDLAAELGVEAGDRLPIRAAGERLEIEVLGLLSAPEDLALEALRDLVIVDLASAQEILQMEGRLSRIDLVLDDAEAATALRERLPPGVDIVAKSARTGALEQMTRAFRLNLTALSLLALTVGTFLIYNAMTFSVVQRRPLLGTLRTLGVTRHQVFGLVLGEAALVGLAGSGLGLLAGIALAQGLVRLVAQTINDLYFALSVQSVAVPWTGLLKGAALGLGGTVLAALRPAREAAMAAPGTVATRSTLERSARRDVRRAAAAGAALLTLSAGLLAWPSKSLGLAFAGLFVFVVGFAALVPAATVFATRLLDRPMRRLFGVLGAMAVRGVASTLSRTGVAAQALVIAVSVTIGVGVMVQSFRSTLIDWLEVTLLADVYLAPADARGGAALDPHILAAIESAPEVAFATTYRRVRVGSPTGPVDLGALRAERPAFDAFDFVRGNPDDAWQRFQHEGAAIVSESLAFHRGLDVGSRFGLLTDRGRQAFEVAGVYRDYGSDRGVVTLARATYDRFFDDPQIFSIGVYPEEGVDTATLVESLRARVGDASNVRWIRNRELREGSLEIFDRTFLITDVLRLLAVAVAFIGVLAALMALQLERRRELGVLRANGLTPRQARGLVTAQCGLLGLVSGLLSLPLGAALAALLVHVINRRSFGWTLNLELPPLIFLQALVLALAAALLAGLYPAHRLSRSSPALALREE